MLIWAQTTDGWNQVTAEELRAEIADDVDAMLSSWVWKALQP